MAERELGTILAVSIGTAIPLEVLIAADKPYKEDYLFMNIRTLYRNYFGSYTDPHGEGAKKFAMGFIDELDTIESTIVNTVVGNMHPIFYFMSNKTLPRQMPKAKIKTPRTEKQKNYEDLERFTFSLLFKNKDWDEKIKVFDSLVKGGNARAFMISHYPLDLLSKPRFQTLNLLESHTGAIKGPSRWITKVTTNEEYQHLPFGPLVIQLLGDGGTQFLSSGQKLIKPLLELAEKNNWTIATGVEKMKLDIRNKMKDKEAAAILLEMMTVRLS